MKHAIIDAIAAVQQINQETAKDLCRTLATDRKMFDEVLATFAVDTRYRAVVLFGLAQAFDAENKLKAEKVAAPVEQPAKPEPKLVSKPADPTWTKGERSQKWIIQVGNRYVKHPRGEWTQTPEDAYGYHFKKDAHTASETELAIKSAKGDVTVVRRRDAVILK